MIPKGERGDDVIANLLALCGDGTRGCHGALHGNPYVARQERRDSKWVRERLGEYISTERPDTVEYIFRKLGDQAGAAYLERSYLLVAM